MQLCYVDESGKAQTLSRSTPDHQPVFLIGAVVIPDEQLTRLTHGWIEIKRQYNPSIATVGLGWQDAIQHEIKGTTFRRAFRSGATMRRRKNALGTIDQTLKLLSEVDARLISRIWVLEEDVEISNPVGMYAHALQFVCGAFHDGLAKDERGMVLVDSQTHHHNHRLAHSLFTQRFAKQPKYRQLVDMPVFGHSENHAGLQVADFLCSALLAPIACGAYCGRYSEWNTHAESGYLALREHFGQRLKDLTFTFKPEGSTEEKPSVVTADPVTKRGARLMWAP